MSSPSSRPPTPLLFVASQALSVSALLVMWLGMVFWVMDSILATFAALLDWVTQTEPLETFVYYQDSTGFGRMVVLLGVLLVGMTLYALGVMNYRNGSDRWKLWMGALSVLSVYVHVKVFLAIVGSFH